MALGLLALVGCSSGGHNLKEEFLDSVTNVTTVMNETGSQLQVTLKSYNVIVRSEASDLVAAYEYFAGELDELDELMDDMKDALSEMNSASNELFGSWSKDLRSYAQDGMREHSQNRLGAIVTRFEKIQATANPARVASDEVYAELNDHLLFLKYDLSPDTIAGLKKDAKSLNKDAQRLIRYLEDTAARSDQFVLAMKYGSDESDAPPDLTKWPDEEGSDSEESDEDLQKWPDEQ